MVNPLTPDTPLATARQRPDRQLILRGRKEAVSDRIIRLGSITFSPRQRLKRFVVGRMWTWLNRLKRSCSGTKTQTLWG